jgi:hypothetical protein
VRNIALLVVLTALALGAAAASGARIPGVKTPSRNISCLFVPVRPTAHGNLLCNIKSAVYLVRLQANCMAGPGLDWHGFTLSWNGKAQVVCAGGIMYDPRDTPTYAVLAYGKTWHHAPFTCTSRLTGLTCVNASGHGLFLSRRSWRAW